MLLSEKPRGGYHLRQEIPNYGGSVSSSVSSKGTMVLAGEQILPMQHRAVLGPCLLLPPACFHECSLRSPRCRLP